MKHAMIYQSLTNPNLYLLGFEDMGGSVSDFDFNDMVVSMSCEGSTSSVPFSVTASTGGSVTVQSSAINNNNQVTVSEGSTQSWPVTTDTAVELNANSNEGYSFGSWTSTNGITGLTNPQSSSISISVTGSSSILASFIKTSPTLGSGTGSAQSPSGTKTDVEASLIKSGNSYNFTLQISPKIELLSTNTEWLFFDDNEINALKSSISTQLHNDGFSSDGTSVYFVGVMPSSDIDGTAVQIVDGLLAIPGYVDDLGTNVEAFGKVAGSLLTTAQVVADNAKVNNDESLGLPVPPEIVIDMISSMFSADSSGIAQYVLSNYPLYLPGQTTSIHPDYIVGPGQELEIVITGLIPPSQGSIQLPICGSDNILPLSSGYLQVTQPNYSPGSGLPLGYEVFPSSFYYPVDLEQSLFFSWENWHFSGDYHFSTTIIQDPLTQFIEAETLDLQLTNPVFDSSSSVLTMSAAILANSANDQGDVNFLVPSELDPTNSTSFSLTFNGASTPFDLTYDPTMGFYINATLTANGTLALYIPSLAPSIALSTESGILFVSGSGFGSNLAVFLQYYNGTNWTDLPNSGNFSTSDTGFFLYQNATPNVSSGILMVRAIDLNGNNAISSIGLIKILSFNATPPSPANVGSMVTLTAEAESPTCAQLLYRFSTNGGAAWDNWNSSNTFQFFAGNASLYYTFLVEVTDGANPLILGPPITYQVTQAQVHDVAVTNIVSNSTIIFRGCTAMINVTVLDNGDFSETANITLYYNITANETVGTQTVTLISGESKTLSFLWNTMGVAYSPNYTLTAVATIPTGDFTPGENALSLANIKVTIVGDVNGDGTVNILDIAMASSIFMSRRGSLNYNSLCDIRGDGIIDILDIVSITRYYSIKVY
jgi:hypothetical protein